MNVKRGLARLLAVVATLYFGFWAVVWYMAWSYGRYFEAHYDVAKGWDDRENAAMLAMYGKSSARLEAALLYGAVPAVALIFLAPFIWWIYRGFKPRDNQNGDK